MNTFHARYDQLLDAYVFEDGRVITRAELAWLNDFDRLYRAQEEMAGAHARAREQAQAAEAERVRRMWEQEQARTQFSGFSDPLSGFDTFRNAFNNARQRNYGPPPPPPPPPPKPAAFDPYAVLGLERWASNAEIKRAYRKLAREHHPDAGGDEGRMKDINRAYDMLKG